MLSKEEFTKLYNQGMTVDQIRALDAQKSKQTTEAPMSVGGAVAQGAKRGLQVADKLTGGMLYGNSVNYLTKDAPKLFSGATALGNELGGSIAAIGKYAQGDFKQGNMIAQDIKPMRAFGGAIQTVADLGSLAVPGGGGVVKPALTMAGLGATSAAGGAMTRDADAGEIFKSALMGGVISGTLSLAASGAGKAIESLTKKAPGRIMDAVVKDNLSETKKAIKYNGETLGDEMVARGIKGSEEAIYRNAISKTEQYENKLQGILSKSKATISRADIEPYLDDIIAQKGATPGLADDVEKIKAVLQEFPEEVPIQKANEIKRNLYYALDDVAFKVDPTLSTKKEAMKTVARGIKDQIEQKTATEAGSGVVRNINKELSVNGRIKDRMLDKIARANKNNLVSMGDYAAMGGGAVVGAATGGSALIGAAAMEGLKRASGSTRVMTNAAVLLNKAGKLIDKLPTDAAGRVSKAAVINLLGKIN